MYLNVGSDTQNIHLEHNIEIKDSTSISCIMEVLCIHLTHSRKFKEEVLNRSEQVRKATKALSSLLWCKHISVDRKKRIFYRVTECILNYVWEIWTVD